MTYPMTGWVPRQVLNAVPVPGTTNQYDASGFDLASAVDEYRTNQGMMGQQPISEFSGDPTEYLTNLYFSGNTQLADEWVQRSGMDRTAFLDNVRRVNEESQARRGSNLLGTIGNLTSVGRGEVSGVGDFLGDAAKLGAIGYATSFLGGGAAPTTGSASATATGAPIVSAGQVAPAAGAGVDVGALVSGGMGPQAAVSGAGAAAAGGLRGFLPAIIGGGMSLLGGKLASDSAGDAVDAMTEANSEALDYQRESRDIALDLLEPDRQSANAATARMLQMQGLPIPAALQADLDKSGVALDDFDVTETPGYQFRFDQSMKALENSAFARGNGMAGGFGEYALRYAQDYASTEYDKIYQQLGMLAGRSTAGGGAEVALNFGGNSGRIAMDTGAGRASGYVAQGNAWQNALDQVAKLPWNQWSRSNNQRPALGYGG